MTITRLGQRERAERTILDLKPALAVVAKKLGINRIAATYGIGPQALYNNLNLADVDRAPTLAQFELITEYAREHRAHGPILDSLSQLTGCIWLPVPQVDTDAHGEIFKDVTALVSRVGKMCEDTQAAVADGRVDDDELAILERDLVRLLQAGYQLVENAKRCGEGR